jgi:putative tryptophan/tyrosine transport system substrate-binding protein
LHNWQKRPVCFTPQSPKCAIQHPGKRPRRFRIFAAEGGLLSYGFDQIDSWRGAATYVDRILRGEKPADLPVQAPTKFELIVNLKTARALGLSIPPAFSLRADEVIE